MLLRGTRDAVNAVLDAAVDTQGGLLERQLGVDALDGALDGRGEELRAALDGADEEVDVALPGVVLVDVYVQVVWVVERGCMGCLCRLVVDVRGGVGFSGGGGRYALLLSCMCVVVLVAVGTTCSRNCS